MAEAMMETQDDSWSLDIAKLQRDALGLDSQHFLKDLAAIENYTSPIPHDSITVPTPSDPILTPASPKVTGNSSVPGAPRARITDHNARGLLDANRPSPERTTRPTPRGPTAGQMGSVETVPSDTQVISQSVYDEIIRKNKEAGKEGPDSNVLDRSTLMTLQEGDSGHIDLLSGFDAAQIHAPTTDENDDQSSSKLGESSPLLYERNQFPESQRFLAKTPLTTTKQGQAEIVSSVSPLISRNPLASDLESGSGVMALSQVFKATQAPSSPMVNGLQSDLLSDRPSPNIPIQYRPLALALSSPFNNIAATFPRKSSDTQPNYVTMKESQANRNDMARERMTRSADHIYSDDRSDGEFDKEPSFIERIKRKRRIDEEAAAQFSMVSAPARHSGDIEERTGRRVIPSSRVSERRDLEDDPRAAVQSEQQGIASDLQAVGTSEEDTEQEEELPKPAPRFQAPNLSTEEDKENCDDPPVALSHAESAHDRLSQALFLHESPAGTRREPTQIFADACSPARNEDINPGTVNMVRSSPISVVKDSQWSPGRDDAEQAEQTIVESPSDQGQNRLRGLQPQSVAAAGHEQGRSSPVNQFFIQGCQVYNRNASADTPSRAEIADPARSSNPSLKGSGGPLANMLRMRNATNGLENGDRTLTFGALEKSSSMPSRVSETPVHRRQRISNDLPFATIPETSPTRLNHEGWMSDGDNEAADQEDDDLPPPYPKAVEHADQSRPVTSQSSSPVKRLLYSKILSSPSGRQRRALTEIAADASPRIGAAAIDVDIDIMSAEDYEFRNAVAQSPIPPRKKRRGNDGRNMPASDPIIPVTPRAKIPPTAPRKEDETVAAFHPQPTERTNQRSDTFLRLPKATRRTGSIWDTEDFPQFRVSSKERSQLFVRSQARELQPPPASEPELEETRQHPPIPARAPVKISSNPVREAPSSELIVEESAADIGQQARVESAILVPNQVLAPWRGQKRAYYPAVCLGTPYGTSQDQYMVKFEDSAPVEVPKGAVKRLELRIGDAVKVDMPHIPKVTHIIRGFAHKLSAEDAVKAVTDIYGHATLVVGQKQRKSLSNGGLAGPENVINVPVSRIYLDTILWNKIKDRSYTYNSGPGGSDSRLQTPSGRHITPTSPSTRLSRSFRPSNGIFFGMVFAVSFGDKSEAKNRTTKMILENDGQILEGGFNELFDLPSNAPIATPTKATASQPAGRITHLRLKPDVEEAGFACLIADKHSRRPKYMQALALNIPCLSDRWVEDCVAKGQIMDWQMYLLPAGESSYLNGATKSRILTPYPAARARLSKTVAARPNLLNGQSVLLITSRNGKADEERRKAYIFLTYALGASKIERVPDIQSARAALHKQLQDGQETSPWDWVYIDDDDKAAKALAARSLPSKKRRNSRLTEAVSGDDLGLSNVRVVGNEFVCQSLILGRLVDQ